MQNDATTYKYKKIQKYTKFALYVYTLLMKLPF